MRAGQLRYRLTLQQPSTTEASGFADVATVAADLRFQPAPSEPMQAGGPAAIASHQARIRFRSDVRASWRAVVDGRTFQVTGYGDPDGRQRELLLLCAEVQ